MDPLVEVLTAGGVLDATAVEWALRYQTEHGGVIDSALLELDLVDEQDLLRGLGACFGMTAAELSQVAGLDPEVGNRVPKSLSESFGMCPVGLVGNELVVLVESPLPEASTQELQEIFGLRVRQIVAPSHYLVLAMQQVYGTPADARTLRLEARLARRRGTDEARRVLDSIAGASTLTAAMAKILEFAARRWEFCCFLVCREQELRLVASRGGRQTPGSLLPPPGTGCTIEAAIRRGGYFMGPIAGTQADRDFYAGLERSLPRWACVAPLPVTGNTSVTFCADNGPRGMANRWVAEITLMVSRLGRLGGDAKPISETEITRERAPADPAPLTAAERVALDRLRCAAGEAGTGIDVFVDDLLRAPASSSTTLAHEVKGLFEKLATDIPSQLARGMEAAFRDMVPRIAVGAPPTAAVTAERPAASAAGVGLVRVEAGPRKVASYRSKRRKSARVKL